MNRQITARMQGDDYQAYIFWSKVCDMFDESKSVEKVAYEYDQIKSIDDVVVFYNDPVVDEYYGSVLTDYYQVKFHATQNGSFTWEDLMNPKFINATSVSLLQKVRNARHEYATDGKGFRFKFLSPWQVHPDDKLSELISNDGGQLRFDKLFKGGSKSAMGKIREKWKEHLGIKTDDELKAVLRPLRIIGNTENIQTLKENLNTALQFRGFKSFSLKTNINPYLDLIRSLQKSEITEFTKEDIVHYCKDADLWIGTAYQKSVVIPVGIRSFSRFSEYMDKEMEQLECILDQFDGRYIKPESNWNEVILPRIEQFLQNSTQKKGVYHLYLEAHASIAFAAGYFLDPKTGVHVAPIQSGNQGRQLWEPQYKADFGKYPDWNNESETLDEKEQDLAVVIGVRHNIVEEVKYFIDQQGLPVKRIVSSTPGEGPGAQTIQDGTHAWILADKLATSINERSFEERKGHLHIFMSGPNALSFFIGQLSRSFGRFTLYEYDFDKRTPGGYEPSFSFPPIKH